jgi:hypothetical protein
MKNEGSPRARSAIKRLGEPSGFGIRHSFAIWHSSFVILCLPFLAPAAATSPYSLRWNAKTSPATVEVAGTSQATIHQLTDANWQTEDWQKLLSVYAVDSLADLSVPAMLGNYYVADGLIRFLPSFPLERGVTYRAVFRPAGLPGAEKNRSPDVVSTFFLPANQHQPATVVARIYPSAKVLPANLLKFYVQFSAPMRRGHIYEHIRLLDETGKAVELPFLEIDEELWNPEMTRLTLFIDPGRIKRGVQPLEEIGPVLEAGKSYTLIIDRSWQDAEGNPLKESYRKSFKAGSAAREPLRIESWRINPPAGGSGRPLRIRFPAPLDHALAQRMIQVTDKEGNLVPGKASLTDAECQWSLTPEKPWSAGSYRIVAQTAIEDLAGNNIGKPFEVDLFEGVQPLLSNPTVSLAFEVK